MATLVELLGAQTKDEIRARLLAALNVAGFPISDWEPGGVARTIVEAQAEAMDDFIGSLLPKVVAGGFVEYAEGAWLTLLAAQLYGLERTSASFTYQNVRLTCEPGAGPYTIAAGESIVEAASGNRYINDEGGTVPAGSSVTLSYKAESPGGAYLDGPGQITKLVTSLPGVSCTNEAGDFSAVGHTGTGTGTLAPTRTVPGVVPTPFVFELTITSTGQIGAASFSFTARGERGTVVTGGATVAAGAIALTGGTSITFSAGTAPSFIAGDIYTFTTPGSAITAQGRDEERDDILRERCQARWPDLGRIETNDKYAIWARLASADVVRTRVGLMPGQPGGRVKVIIGGTTNPLPGGTITAVQNYIDQRAAITELPIVVGATARACPTTGAVTVRARDLTAVQAKAQAAWNAYVASLDIGEAPRVAELAQALMDAGALDFGGLTVDGSYSRPFFNEDEIAATSGTLAGSLTWLRG